MKKSKKHYFLTSNPMSEDRLTIREDNDLVERLRLVLPKEMKAVFVASDPNAHREMDHFADEVKTCFENSGFTFSSCILLDGRNEGETEQLIVDADFLLFLGGHVPTQNAFMQKIQLKDHLKSSDAVIMGFSAGSMNMADIVYAMPELGGEAVDPNYKRFIPGLSLTKIMVIPHYQYLKTVVLDGQRMIEDIAYQDSHGREFIAIPDGSYVEIEGDSEIIYGEYYKIKDGTMK